MPTFDVHIDYFESAQSTRGQYTFRRRVCAPDRKLACDRALGEFTTLKELSYAGWMAEVLDVRADRVAAVPDESFEDAASQFRRSDS